MWPSSRSPAMLIVIVTLVLLVVLVAADAQPQAKLARIAFLGLPLAPPASALPPVVTTFQQRLRELGWVEGQNLTTEWRWAEGRGPRTLCHPGRGDGLVSRWMSWWSRTRPPPKWLDRRRRRFPSFTVGGGRLSADDPQPRAARRERHGVYGSQRRVVDETAATAHARDPRAHPRGSAPGARPPKPGVTGDGGRGPRVGGAAPASGGARPGRDRPCVCRGAQAGAGALLVFTDGGLLLHHRVHIADLAVKNKLPSIFGERQFVEAGGLMSYGANTSDRGQRLTAYVDKILKGAKPADLPFERPTTFEFVINLKTAQALGVTISPTLLFQATEVIR